MPTFSFTGFAADSGVTLSATQGSATDNGSVTGWGTNTTLGSVSILTRRADHLFAPSAVWLEATDVSGFALSTDGGPVYDPSYHELQYIWTVRGQPLAPFEAPENMVDGWNNPNVMYGKKVAFYFPQAGNYIVDLWAIDSEGTTAIAETTVTVQNEAAANARYAGTNTVCLSTSGDFTDAPAGAELVTVTSGSQIDSLSNSFFTTPTRFLFRAGDTFDNVSMWVRGQMEMVGAFGPGPRPILNENGSAAIFKRGDGAQHTIFGLDCRGRWDSVTETGSAISVGPLFFRDAAAAAKVTVCDCLFDGFSLVETSLGNSSVTGSLMIFADNVCTNWRDYGIFAGSRGIGKYHAVIGCRLAQHVDALNGGPKNGDHNTHGPIRVALYEHQVFAQLDMFSRTGWSNLAPDRGDQPCMRINSSQEIEGNNAVFDRLVCEGGFNLIAIAGQNSGEAEFAGNYLMDRLLLIATAKSAFSMIQIECGGTTVRNTLGIFPEVPDYHNNWQAAIELEFNVLNATNRDSPVRIYNNTFVNLQSDAQKNGSSFNLTKGGQFTNVTLENNVLHAPDIGSGARTGDAPIDLATDIPGVTPRYRGVRYNTSLGGSGTMDPTYESPGSLPLPRPGTNSVALNSGDSGERAYFDFLGNVRPGPGGVDHLGNARPATGNERGAVLES